MSCNLSIVWGTLLQNKGIINIYIYCTSFHMLYETNNLLSGALYMIYRKYEIQFIYQIIQNANILYSNIQLHVYLEHMQSLSS